MYMYIRLNSVYLLESRVVHTISVSLSHTGINVYETVVCINKTIVEYVECFPFAIYRQFSHSLTTSLFPLCALSLDWNVYIRFSNFNRKISIYFDKSTKYCLHHTSEFRMCYVYALRFKTEISIRVHAFSVIFSTVCLILQIFRLQFTWRGEFYSWNSK